MLTKNVVWQLPIIEREKEIIKQELRLILETKSPKAKLEYILRKIRALESERTPISQLQRYIYVMSCLVHHERFGGLSRKEIKGLFEIGLAIIRIQGIKSIKSTLSFLYGDLYLVMSQINRSKNGDHWLAAWQHQLFRQLSKRRSLADQGFDFLAQGLRASRLGFSVAAIDSFLLAENSNSSFIIVQKARLGRIRALRVSNESEPAQSLIKETMTLSGLDERIRKDLEWETICCDAQKTQNLDEMTKIVSKGKDFYESSYFLEAKLWTYSVANKIWVNALPKIKNAARDKNLNLPETDYLYGLLFDFEKCLEKDIPIFLRIVTLGDILSRAGNLLSIDRELLLFAAGARWLARNKALHFAAYAINRYRFISLGLSQGKTEDTLGVLENLLNKKYV